MIVKHNDRQGIVLIINSELKRIRRLSTTRRSEPLRDLRVISRRDLRQIRISLFLDRNPMPSRQKHQLLFVAIGMHPRSGIS